MPPEDRHDPGMLTPLGPRKRRGPRFIVGKVRRGAAGEETLHHFDSVRAGRPGERCRCDQAAVMQSVPFGVGARVEQELDGLQVPFSRGEMDDRGVPVFRAAEPRVSFEQPEAVPSLDA